MRSLSGARPTGRTASGVDGGSSSAPRPGGWVGTGRGYGVSGKPVWRTCSSSRTPHGPNGCTRWHAAHEHTNTGARTQYCACVRTTDGGTRRARNGSEQRKEESDDGPPPPRRRRHRETGKGHEAASVCVWRTWRPVFGLWPITCEKKNIYISRQKTSLHGRAALVDHDNF